HGLPIVLHIPLVRPPARQPRSELLRERRAGHGPEQEGRERVSRVGNERRLRSAEVVRAARQCSRGRVVAGANQLLAGFERMLADYFREVILKRESPADVLKAGEPRQSKTDVEIRERPARDIRYAKLFRPSLVLREGRLTPVAPVVSCPEFIVRGRAENQ